MQRDTTGPGDASRPPARPAVFRLAVVPGVSPAKWVRVWHERLPDVTLELVHVPAADAAAALRAGRADAGLVRLPVDRDVLSAIPLYTETTVVVVPTDHVVVAADEVTAADLVDEAHLVPADDVLGPEGQEGRRRGRPGEGGPDQATTGDASPVPAPATTADAVELVAAGVGVLLVPQSLARLHHRRDLTYRPVTDAPTSSVGLAWVTAAGSDLVEELIGIVRGRTANSSRGTGGRPTAPGTDRAPAARTPGASRAVDGRPGATGRARGGAGGGRGPRRSDGRRGTGRTR